MSLGAELDGLRYRRPISLPKNTKKLVEHIVILPLESVVRKPLVGWFALSLKIGQKIKSTFAVTPETQKKGHKLCLEE